MKLPDTELEELGEFHCWFQLGKSQVFITKYWTFQTTSAKTPDLAAMEKATENLNALESSLLRLTKPGGYTIKTLLTFFYGIFSGLFAKNIY